MCFLLYSNNKYIDCTKFHPKALEVMKHSSEPLSWLDNIDQKYKQEIISWFNDKMDSLVIKQNLLQFNNPRNYLNDVVDALTDMVRVYTAPDVDCTDKEFEYFISLNEDKEDIGRLTLQYCKCKFNQTAI